MGYRGTVNTALAFGTDAPAVGHLVGEPHHGLRYMFHMMNEARVAVGLGASMLGYAGYRYSLDYARERTQGRHPDKRDASSAPVPIIEHADVRRMLLTQKALAEGGLALSLHCARLIDAMAGHLHALGHDDAGTLAGSVMSELVGALSLARGEPDRGRSDALLDASRHHIFQRLKLEHS